MWLTDRRQLLVINLFAALFLLLLASPTTSAAIEGFRDCPDCPELTQAPPGRFMMGSPAGEEGHDDSESPVHAVTIGHGFAVGRYPVTFEQWDACVAAGGCNGYKPDDRGWGRGSRPVINVSWKDAQAYVQWLSAKSGKPYRLLSEAEFEYVARAGTSTARYWGEEIGKHQANCNGCGSPWDKVKTAPVGSFPPNSWGLYDILGNVWTWTQDCWADDYARASTDGSARKTSSCQQHALRGGSWYRNSWNTRAASRVSASTDDRGITIGFRIARDLP